MMTKKALTHWSESKDHMVQTKRGVNRVITSKEEEEEKKKTQL